ncbi:internal alternative NAD(P)H-ubiquinone oxidoreductase A1, mitochondrial-like [Stegodyphus dumicola]|uniref:internal alternative NAD(P)H-ubiquinone oxidoreductase A1, mitochondrial-like n=1 Tax=Stegodyphus dumicola TaxID=202533 RepID=UPI0015A95FCD|nr:internal alternative NAD(P)H-ubiquinone oxidoreductase A1, mitochondrial-like [Stegodyphus dumicola]
MKLINVNRMIANIKRLASSVTEKKTRIVILGSGWASYSVLKEINRKLFDIKIVTPRNHFLFTPLLCSTTVGTLEFRSITEPIRNIGLANPQDLMLAHAEDINLEKQTILCQSVLDPELQFSLPYDKLIIGVGCLNNTFGIPGVEKYAFFLKEISDAQKIRRKILRNCEKALAPTLSEKESQRLLHTVIVGGGPTGIEFGAELYDFKIQDVKRLYKHQEALFKVTLIEASNILGSFDSKLRAYAEKKLNERINFTLLKSSVIEVKEDCVILQDGTTIPCGLVVWSTGLSPQPFTKRLLVPKNNKGQILTDGYLRVLGEFSENVFAIGDCADIQSMPLPCTAQVAERQGRYLAHCLNKSANGNNKPPFHFKSAGMLAYIGGYKALTDLPDFKAQGFSSWFLWRSAYLTRLGSWRLRMQVPIDWLKTLLFGRDTSHFY